MSRPRTIARLLPAIALVLACAVAGAASAQYGAGVSDGSRRAGTPADGVPAELQGVDIVEKLEAQLPLDVPFTDDTGRTITLRDCFDGKHPVVLQIGYLKCPMLCNLVLNDLVRGLKGVDWTVGQDFAVVSISVNPNESHELAAAKKQGYIVEYERADTAANRAGWRFLTGPESSSRAVADAAGFGYRFIPETGEYAHAAAIMLCTPDGKLSRYLYGVKFAPADLRLGLLEASQGRIGSTLDRFILWCHIYDPEARGYVVFALRLMKLGGALTLLALFAGLSMLWVRDLKRRRVDDAVEPALAGNGAPRTSDAGGPSRIDPARVDPARVDAGPQAHRASSSDPSA
ncbi:MAG: SCO family protein [Phycisphaerales bacterium]